jgi:hypothetical protein
VRVGCVTLVDGETVPLVVGDGPVHRRRGNGE